MRITDTNIIKFNRYVMVKHNKKYKSKRYRLDDPPRKPPKDPPKPPTDPPKKPPKDPTDVPPKPPRKPPSNMQSDSWVRASFKVA